MRKFVAASAMAALLAATPAMAKWPGNSGPGNQTGQNGQNGQNGNNGQNGQPGNGNNGNNGNNNNNGSQCMGWHEDNDKAQTWYYRHYGADYSDYMEWYEKCYDEKYD
jgi:hypothetical protein